MGKNKKNRSKQRKAKAAAKAAVEEEEEVEDEFPDHELIAFHPDDDVQGLLEYLQKGKSIDCIKLARFLPNAAKDVLEGTHGQFDIFASIMMTLGSKAKDLSEKTVNQLGDAVQGFQSPVSSIKDSCWQCQKVAPRNLSICSGCHTANYCSMECQLQAWKEGHKETCSRVAVKFQLLQESMDIIEATHSENSLFPDGKYNIFSDYCLLAIIHGFPSGLSPLGKEYQNFVENASMKYFYQNLARIQQGWYPVSELDTTTDVDEHIQFTVIAQFLSFDLLTYYVTVYPQEKHPEKRVDFIPALQCISLSAERFVELYHTGQEKWCKDGAYVCSEWEGEKADSKERWKRTRRILERSAIRHFQKWNHTNKYNAMFEEQTGIGSAK